MDLELQEITPNVFTTDKLRGCNPSFVVTSEGVVVIDTPQLPSHAVAFRKEAERHGPIKYVINTEHHVDHIFGNYYFKGAGAVIHHKLVYDNFMTVYPQLDPFSYAEEALEDDPEGRKIFPSREEYYEDPNKGEIVVSGDTSLHVGDHTFNMLHTPGHTPGQMAVHVPEERVVFSGDTIFSHCQTWLMTSDLDSWIASLDRLRTLDVDLIIPGHGPAIEKSYIHVQKALLLEWITAVAVAISKGWSREKVVDNISFSDRGPVDIGQGHMMDYIQTLNAGAIYDKLIKE